MLYVMDKTAAGRGPIQVGNRRFDPSWVGATAKGRVALLALVLSTVVSSAALAQVPKEFLGEWWSTLAPCEQSDEFFNGLTINPYSLGFYEIGCERLSTPTKLPAGILRFKAACFKGGSPQTNGWVELGRGSKGEIYLKLDGFSWTASKFETYRRCPSSK
ncbi:hypothetical protein [Mesorhizobium sp. 1M-11]|uniref:hypothetical protein n=1 Tax=Mesorhizobium sp. 1M-11 TaxID=1529006 RepID=UPI0006C757D7|nr:hypothetical protein [Mesorhizobium sp. 1M-11]